MRTLAAFLLIVTVAAGAGLGSPPISPVRTISLPHDEPFAPPGPGRMAFVAACVVCHSTRYITSQPPLSRAVWQGIVEKMIHNYGAHIGAPQAAQIVDYLVATNGAHSGGEGE
jgi:mono/diheme cytochrome c family protein